MNIGVIRVRWIAKAACLVGWCLTLLSRYSLPEAFLKVDVKCSVSERDWSRLIPRYLYDFVFESELCRYLMFIEAFFVRCFVPFFTLVTRSFSSNQLAILPKSFGFYSIKYILSNREKSKYILHASSAILLYVISCITWKD